MPRIVSLLVVLCLTACALSGCAGSGAEAEPVLQRVEISLWPEYDQPAMLVIYRVTLAEGTAIPATISLPIPARVGEPSAVAQDGGEGRLVLAGYELQPAQGEWADLAIRAETTRLQVEYYDALSSEGEQRTYSLEWPAGWPVGELAYEVQQPSGVASMEIEPVPAEARLGSDGLTYYTGSLGAQDGAASASLVVRYAASGSGLTAAVGEGTPAISGVDTSAQDPLWSRWIPWVIGGVGTVALAAGAALYLRARRERSIYPRPRHQPSRRRSAGAQTTEPPTVFCHSCGAQAETGDLFCGKCGTRLRA